MQNTANPVLVEFTRGNWVENRHRAAFCIADSSGRIVASAGDIEHPIFPRSAIKSLQALALFESGAVEQFDLDDRDLALACASHKGEPIHVDGVKRFLDKIGMKADQLECGAHVPSDKAAREAMRANGEMPTALHNNCSGKHTGMLAVAKALGVDPKGYIEQDHAVQKLVRSCVEKVVGETMSTDRCGRDGCSIPTWRHHCAVSRQALPNSATPIPICLLFTRRPDNAFLMHARKTPCWSPAPIVSIRTQWTPLKAN